MKYKDWTITIEVSETGWKFWRAINPKVDTKIEIRRSSIPLKELKKTCDDIDSVVEKTLKKRFNRQMDRQYQQDNPRIGDN
jgi:hypothetical protein